LKRSNKSFSQKADIIVNKWKSLIAGQSTSNGIAEPVKKNEKVVKKVPIAIKKIPTAASETNQVQESPSLNINGKKRSTSSLSTNNNISEKKQKLSLNDYINKRTMTNKNEDNSNDNDDDDDDFDDIFGEEEENDVESFNKNSDKIKEKLIEKQKPPSFWSNDADNSVVIKKRNNEEENTNKKEVKKIENKNKIIEPPKPLAPLPSTLGITVTSIDTTIKPSSNMSTIVNKQSSSTKLKVSDDISKYLNSKPSKRFVFSGTRKGGEANTVSKLYDLCIKTLTDSIDWLPQRIYSYNLSKLEDNGLPVAFDLVKPIIERANWKQLESVENYSPVQD
jgi:hypothetical protein